MRMNAEYRVWAHVDKHPEIHIHVCVHIYMYVYHTHRDIHEIHIHALTHSQRHIPIDTLIGADTQSRRHILVRTAAREYSPWPARGEGHAS